MKTHLTLLLSLCLAIESHARLMQSWNYEQLNEKATLVVIACPTNVTETPEVAALPNIGTVYPGGRTEPVMGKGIETSFEVLTVLKGDRNTKTLVLHHFALVKPPGGRGPWLVSFDPKDKKQFLMFLQKEADGRYVAVSGQTDPYLSIKEIAERW